MLIDKHKVKTTFGNAAPSYDAAAVVQKEILARLLDKIAVLGAKGRSVLDIGSGTGLVTHQLTELLEAESTISMDLALPMLKFAKQNQPSYIAHNVCADAEALPFKDNSFDVIFSASTLQWCNNIEQVFDDCLRLLRPDGLFIFSTFGPDTLHELRDCFAQADMENRVNAFIDMHLLGDGLLKQGFTDPVMEVDRIQLLYEKPVQLLHDLKLVGATNNMDERARGLLSKRRLEAVLAHYDQYQLPSKKYPASYEVIYGHAWKRQLGNKNTNSPTDWQPVAFK